MVSPNRHRARPRLRTIARRPATIAVGTLAVVVAATVAISAGGAIAQNGSSTSSTRSGGSVGDALTLLAASTATRSGGATIYHRDDLALWSNRSTGSFSVDLAADGTRFGIHGHGTRCDAAPRVAVTVDGRSDGVVTVPVGSAEVQVDFAGTLSAGHHTVAVRLVNDRYRPGHCDTNAFIRDLWLSSPETTTSPTSGGGASGGASAVSSPAESSPTA